MKPFFILCLAAFCMTTPALGAGSKAEASAREFVLLLSQNEFNKAAALFDAKMRKAVTPAGLQAIWERQLNAAGSFRQIRGTRSEVAGAYRMVIATCQFSRQSLDVKVVFDAAGDIAGLFFAPTEKTRYHPPEYANRSAFTETKIKVGYGEYSLPGTLTLPAGAGPFPAMVLVHGSGPHDRDESIGPNKPFRDLAWGLASKGIAVLRYEKRTRQYATKFANNADDLTVQEETIADALEAVAFLKRRARVNADHIFVLGHSLGGMLIPRIGEQTSDVAGFILMAANARPLEDLILEQTLFQATLKGELSAGEKIGIAQLKEQIAAIKALSADTPSRSRLLGIPAGYWLDINGYKPARAARAIAQPMLIMQGEKDCQVSFARDFNAWRSELSGKERVDFQSYSTLNHLFMQVEGKSTGAEYQQPANVAEAVIEDIADWVRKH